MSPTQPVLSREGLESDGDVGSWPRGGPRGASGPTATQPVDIKGAYEAEPHGRPCSLRLACLWPEGSRAVSPAGLTAELEACCVDCPSGLALRVPAVINNVSHVTKTNAHNGPMFMKSIYEW